MNPQPHVRFIVACITLLAFTAALCGAWLLWKGFAGGGELVMTVNTAIAGMIGFLSNRGQKEIPPDSTSETVTVQKETIETNP